MHSEVEHSGFPLKFHRSEYFLVKSQDDISILELPTVLSMKDVISFVCTEVPFLVDAEISLRCRHPVIFSLKISVMFSGRATPDIDDQNSRDRKLPRWNSERKKYNPDEETLLEPTRL